MMIVKNGMPRRCSIYLMTPAELAVRTAKLAIEDMPADVRLTEATILLSQAQEKIADYVDSILMESK